MLEPTPAQLAEAQRRRKEAQDIADSEAASWPAREEGELRRLMELVLGSNRKIYTDETDIFVDPPLNGSEPGCRGLYAKILQAKPRLIAMLPFEPQPPQRI